MVITPSVNSAGLNINHQKNQEKIEDTITILNKYVEDSDFDLDKEKVKTLLREVYQEACEIE